MNELNQQQLDSCLTALLQLRTELEGLLKSTKEGTEPVQLDLPIGRLSRMDAIQQQKMAEAQFERTKRRLAQVNLALSRARGGNYGECVRCGDPIGYERLKAFPENPICRECLAAKEDE